MTQGRDETREARLAAYRDGNLPPDERAALEATILADPEASEELYAQLGIQDALERARGAAPRAALRRLFTVVLPLAAAIALLWLGPRWQQQLSAPPEPPRFRSLPGTLRGLEPQGELAAAPRQFRWQREPSAAQYRFELYDREATLRYDAVARDTLLILPADAAAVDAGFWRVVPVDSAGAELRPSEPLHFTSPDARR